MIHLFEGTLISWWAEHPVGLPLNTSEGDNSEGWGRGEEGDKSDLQTPGQTETTEDAVNEGSGGEEGRSGSDVAPMTMVGGFDTSLLVTGRICL